MLATIAEIAGSVGHELVAVVAETVAAATMRHLGAALQPRDNGVSARILVTPSAGLPGKDRLGPRSAPPIAVRFASTPVQELVIVDGRTAFVGVGAEVTPTSSAAIISSLYALFNSVWELSGRASRGVPVPDLDNEVLAQLRDGWTDEVAARRIGISVRTYRRYVAKLMQDMGATSRFQAGVLASERGLVQALPTQGRRGA